jgi:hypothetical protein
MLVRMPGIPVDDGLGSNKEYLVFLGKVLYGKTIIDKKGLVCVPVVKDNPSHPQKGAPPCPPAA